jgi:transaldolase
MTLVFGCVQALACAQAGVSVISPFIGRVKDWWDAEGGNAHAGQQSLTQHPGILLVRDIRATYSALGYGGKTQIMAAGFRTVEEIVELGKYGVEGGPDIVTLPPHLLDGLRAQKNVDPPQRFNPRPTLDVATPEYFGNSDSLEGGSIYARDILHEKIAAVKVPEGLAKFSADAQILEDLVKRVVIASTEVSAML